ncbi:MAG: butyrate kinase [Coriobacteriales bacterium]|jgi:butyrate kinase|nr:butyrate kinase [Coriobacteriales bacterium]
MTYKLFTLSPGSTSTKLAVFEDEELIFKANVSHDPEVLKTFARVADQLPYRVETILNALNEAGISIDEMDAFAAYSGGLASTPGGIFPVNANIIKDSTSGRLFEHPAMLGATIIDNFAGKTGKPAYLVNPPDVDEFEDVARVTGIKGIYRESHVHVLNQKEVALRAAKELGKRIDECNFVVCHVGGGLSITAQRKGLIIDGNDVLNGVGPMAPNRSGDIPLLPLVKRCFSGDYTEAEIRNTISKSGGLMSLLGTDSTLKINEMIKEGDEWAKLVYEAFGYGLAKQIGSYAAVLKGEIDAIVMTGGVSNDRVFIDAVKEYAGWIAPFIVFGGDFEMEALASGAIRALSGEEETKEYTGIPVWEGFSFEH